MKLVTRNIDGGWTITGNIDAIQQGIVFDAITSFGFLVPRGSELNGEDFAGLIRAHYANEKAWAVAANLEMIDV